MPRFAFTPIDDDPFDTSQAIDYARELGGAPDAPGTIGESLRQDLASAPNRLMSGLGRVATRFEDLGNALMGNRLVVQTPDGPIDVTKDSMIDAGADLSILVSGSGSLASKPANSLGVFAGRNAKTANLVQLERAKKLMDGGATPDEVWQMTGWAQGKDGEWRFEIPDQASKFNENALQPWSPDETSRAREFWQSKKEQIPGLRLISSDPKARAELEEHLGAATNLENLLDHPALYEAYPDLRKMRVNRVEREGEIGYYDPEGNYIAMTPKGSTAVSHGDRNDGHSVMLHEVQHAIQSREGFAHGGSSDDPQVAKKGQEILDRVKARIAVLRSQIENSPIVEEDAAVEYANWVRLRQQLESSDPGTLGYQALAGEVEARNVTRRFDIGQSELGIAPSLREVHPKKTEDTPRSIQWVRRPDRWYHN